jgi:uncharacterized membrane protein YphA (DoxX/SURF4 family)
MKLLANISRILTGLVFIFSGFVKGVDPLGTAYRIEDYFIAYGTEWAIPAALFLSVVLCTLEFVLGIAMLFNLALKRLAWILLALMVFFTVLTYFDAVYNPVPDCGCFGDAIKLDNWQTFYKNIILILLVISIFAYRKKFRPILGRLLQYAVILVTAAVFAFFSLYQYNHLPWIDFMDWKTGNDLVPDDPGQAKTYLIYRNSITGETKEYLSPDYPWNDTAWLAQWEFVDQRIDDSGVKKGHSLVIFDTLGNDVTVNFIENPSYQFLLVSYDLKPASQSGLQKALALHAAIDEAGYSFIALTGSLKEEIDEFTGKNNSTIEFYLADDIELKTMVRSNPGLILLRDGIVLDKWHYHDFPDIEDLRRDYLDDGQP